MVAKALWLISISLVMGSQINFEGIPNNSTLAACESNTQLLNHQLATLMPGDTFLIPNTTFYV